MSDDNNGPDEVDSDAERRGWDAAIGAAMRACTRVGNGLDFKTSVECVREIAKLEMGGGQ